MKETRILAEPGKIYRNKGGGDYLCIRNEGENAIMRHVVTGWTLKANGIIQYEDGTIEWDYSTEGHFENKRDQFIRFLEENYGSLDKFPERDVKVCNGIVLESVRVIGNDECFDGDEFYQYILAGNHLYKAFFETWDEGGELLDLDGVDYSNAYRVEDVTDNIIC